MDITLMQHGQEALVIDLVKEVFDKYVAPGYAQEGIAEFYKFANVESLSTRSKENHFTVLAKEGQQILGILEIRDLGHISMFFVRSGSQGKGVGKVLLKDAIKRIKKERGDLIALTVNSSPNAVAAYKKHGFIAKAGEQCINGIRFVPMVLVINTEVDS
ncbi:MAG: GNAT family N-acetyltransferase [Desulfobacterales bacterium]|nr:GNAT family N-acetyltransferase [Desulfobacterales bacterium]